MEEAAAALSHSIDAGRKDKSQLLADIVETEKQVPAMPCTVGTSLLPFFHQLLSTLGCSTDCRLMIAKP